MRFLGRLFQATNDERYKTAFVKGLDYILKAQYANGGWPQFYPPLAKPYQRFITFNDDAMVRVMEFLREVYRDDIYEFAGAEHRQSARAAFDRGIACILKCQIKANGKLTAWCAQYDEKDLSPRPARRGLTKWGGSSRGQAGRIPPGVATSETGRESTPRVSAR